MPGALLGTGGIVIMSKETSSLPSELMRVCQRERRIFVESMPISFPKTFEMKVWNSWLLSKWLELADEAKYFKLSYCDWWLKGQHPLWRWTISKFITYGGIHTSLPKITFVCMTYCLMLSKEQWTGNQLCWNFVLALPLVICLDLHGLLRLSQLSLLHL